MSVVAYDVVQILQIVGMLQFPADEIRIYGTSLFARSDRPAPVSARASKLWIAPEATHQFAGLRMAGYF